MDSQSNGTTVSAVSIPHMTEAEVRERIRVLGHEISRLLDGIPQVDFMAINPAGKNAKMPVSICCFIDEERVIQALPETPWDRAHRLSKELSETLTECNGGKWYACIWPVGAEGTGFARIPHPDDPELPVDRVNRLAQELGDAMDDWHEHAGTKFFANVYRTSSGRGAWFRNEKTEGRS